jgi:hypothetical protein
MWPCLLVLSYKIGRYKFCMYVYEFSPSRISLAYSQRFVSHRRYMQSWELISRWGHVTDLRCT